MCSIQTQWNTAHLWRKLKSWHLREKDGHGKYKIKQGTQTHKNLCSASYGDLVYDVNQCVCVCVCIFVYTCTYSYIHTYIHIYVEMWVKSKNLESEPRKGYIGWQRTEYKQKDAWVKKKKEPNCFLVFVVAWIQLSVYWRSKNHLYIPQ